MCPVCDGMFFEADHRALVVARLLPLVWAATISTSPPRHGTRDCACIFVCLFPWQPYLSLGYEVVARMM